MTGRRAVHTAVIGAGFGGVAAGYALKQEGHEDFVILERGDRVGGVWRANTYPGICCDVPSHLYSLSFAPNPQWSKRFSPGPEIQRYLEDVVKRFELERHVRLNANVLRATYDEARNRWRLELGNGDILEADVIISACGQLTRPITPGIPGLERFAGKAFHSAEWPEQADLVGARVAVVGTGASAIQFAPAIASEAEHVAVFQRSAPWILPKQDTEYGPLALRIYSRFPSLQRAARRMWELLFESVVPVFTGRPRPLAWLSARVFRALSTLQRIVQLRGNRRLIRAATPDYPMGCKRVLLTSDWYPMLRRENVELVTSAIVEINAEEVITEDGVRHPVDAIIFGTGFTATEFLAPMEVRGRGGVALTEAWKDGAEAYLGITVPGFPNLFLLYGPNTNHGTGSAVTLIEAQARYSAEAVSLLAEGAADSLEIRKDVHDAFGKELDARLADTVWTQCASWYVSESGRVTNQWVGTQAEYRRRVAHVDLTDYRLSTASSSATRSPPHPTPHQRTAPP